MKVIFLGNGPFAVPVLDRLASSDHSLRLVVARPDRPQGKHQALAAGPVRARAESLGLVVEQPSDVNSEACVDRLTREQADVLVVADFGQILSSPCLATTRHGGINVHASLLPKYRGAAPVAWAMYHGERQTGVSIIRMTPKLDAGGILLQAATPISPEETSGELESRLAVIGADLTMLALEKLESGSITVVEQDASQMTRAPRLTKEDGRIRWDRSAKLVRAQVRAMQPWPVAFTDWNRGDGPPMRLQVLEVLEWGESGGESQPPGTVTMIGHGTLRVATGEGGEVLVGRVKPAGKREMDVQTFLNGHRVAVGDRFS